MYEAEIKTILEVFGNAGFNPTEVWDGEESTIVKTQEEAHENIVAVEEAYLYLQRSEDEKVTLQLLMGNDVGEAICDYGCSHKLYGEVDRIYKSICNALVA